MNVGELKKALEFIDDSVEVVIPTLDENHLYSFELSLSEATHELSETGKTFVVKLR